MNLKEKIIALLSESNNLTDTRLSSLIFQDKNQHQKINKACRELETQKNLIRNSDAGIIRNCLVSNDLDSKNIVNIYKSKSFILLKETYNRETELKESFNVFMSKSNGLILI